jgi:uncharacterized protein
MALSLYDATVPVYRQLLTATRVLLDKAETYCADKRIAPADVLNARLHEDMLPFTYQVKSTVVHSVVALQSLAKGVFSPDMSPPPDSFAALKQKLDGALGALESFTPNDINAYEGGDMAFSFKEFRLEFTAETFLLSFSMPNFYFHATTAYDILRHKGVPIGKRDFVGRLRTKGS